MEKFSNSRISHKIPIPLKSKIQVSTYYGIYYFIYFSFYQSTKQFKVETLSVQWSHVL